MNLDRFSGSSTSAAMRSQCSARSAQDINIVLPLTQGRGAVRCVSPENHS
jgi:hypothetical protein